ncbi:MAG: class I SAM-dependent methyltransferase [Erysipelotrichaceae bacterium]|nr:class I SAM-dependent methyltransferase [Erysipelotrichaceae bacterium]
MKRPDYKNWMPKGMILSFAAGAVICLLVRIAIGARMAEGRWKAVLSVLFLIGTLILSLAALWCYALYRAFDYNGKRQMSKQIIEGIAGNIDLKNGGKVLDVGCGSGALAIAVAKRHPEAEVIGIDRWGKEYASFSLKLCEDNAEAEGVSNVSFRQGDALRLDFADETFDAVTSNYVYHNIPSKDRQAILLETLRTLKKGGQFALHDIFSVSKYGDMDAFVKKLKDMGYEKVELIDTTDGMWISKTEALFMELAGSALLKGIK